jgi:phosphoglycerol transferase MdoB-like AlkP superfamily enzyme
LFSYPALLAKHPMRNAVMKQYSGISQTLLNESYHTMYFTSHDGQFDNTEGFLYNNSFVKVYSQSDYPSKEILSTLGVPDHYLFSFSIKKIDEIYKASKLFFSVILTSSNHSPVIIPKNISFIPRSNNKYEQIVEYSDWAIGNFLREASNYEWFKNTVFVFTADHGGIVGTSPYDIPLSYNHIPLIIYAPHVLAPKTFNEFGGQIDIYPILLDLLNIEYDNNTMGVNILKTPRPCMYFSADDKIACINNEYLYVYRVHGAESLYKYRNGDVKNYIDEEKFITDRLRNYAFSMLQTSQWIIKNKHTKKHR